MSDHFNPSELSASPNSKCPTTYGHYYDKTNKDPEGFHRLVLGYCAPRSINGPPISLKCGDKTPHRRHFYEAALLAPCDGEYPQRARCRGVREHPNERREPIHLEVFEVGLANRVLAKLRRCAEARSEYISEAR
jgi:hypothetical protein